MSLWCTEVTIGQSCLHVLLTIILPGRDRVGPEAFGSPWLWEIGLHSENSGPCWPPYVWFYWCGARAAVGWKHPTVSPLRWLRQMLWTKLIVLPHGSGSLKFDGILLTSILLQYSRINWQNCCLFLTLVAHRNISVYSLWPPGKAVTLTWSVLRKKKLEKRNSLNAN